MTNDPDDLAVVVLEPEFVNRYRLATNADNPLSKILGPGPLRVGCSSVSFLFVVLYLWGVKPRTVYEANLPFGNQNNVLIRDTEVQC